MIIRLFTSICINSVLKKKNDLIRPTLFSIKYFNVFAINTYNNDKKNDVSVSIWLVIGPLQLENIVKSCLNSLRINHTLGGGSPYQYIKKTNYLLKTFKI